MDPEQRFDALWRQHEPRLRSFLRARCRGLSGVEADDVLQELRVKLWQLLEREKTLANPASYLMQAAASTLIDAQRRAAVRSPEAGFAELDPEAAGHAPTPESLAAQAQDYDRLASCLGRMSDDRARMVGLYLQGFGSVEIARLTGWSEPRCRNLLYRGLADLRECMERDE